MNTETLQESGFSCPLCGEHLPSNATECTKCDWVTGYRQAQQPRPKNPHDILAAVLSLVLPGAGHYFKGYRTMAWIILLLGVPIVLVFAFAFTMFFGWFLVPTYWVAVAADAFLRKDLRPGFLPPQPV
jgi:ribosomal protein L40E